MKRPDMGLVQRDLLSYLRYYRLPTHGALDAVVARMQSLWRQANPPIVLANCSECGGDSDARLPECPFCGEPGQAVTAPKDEVLTAADGQPLPQPGTTVDDLDEAVARVARQDSRVGVATYDLGLALRDIQERGLWRLRLDQYKLPAYRSFYDFVEEEIGLRRGATRRWIRITEQFSRDEVEAYGVTRLAQALRFPVEEQSAFLAEVADQPSGQAPKVARTKMRRRVRQQQRQEAEAQQQAPTDAPTGEAPDGAQGAAEGDSFSPSVPWPLWPQEGSAYDKSIPLGRTVVPLWCREASGGRRVDEPTRAAVSTEEAPWTRVCLRPDLHLRITTRQNDAGELEAVLELRRVDVVGSKHA